MSKRRLWVCRGLAVKGRSESDLVFSHKVKDRRAGRACPGSVKPSGGGWPRMRAAWKRETGLVLYLAWQAAAHHSPWLGHLLGGGSG